MYHTSVSSCFFPEKKTTNEHTAHMCKHVNIHPSPVLDKAIVRSSHS